MGILDVTIVGFLVILLASLLMFGELLVKTKGIFGIVSFLLFFLYFAHHLPNQSPIFMVALLLVGFVLIILDGKLISNGSIAIIGIFMMMLACALPTPSLIYGVGVSAAFLIGVGGSFLFLKVFEPRAFWSKITLMDQLTSEKGYDSINQDYKLLVGEIGKTLTPFRPVGTIDVQGKSYSAISNGVWLESGVAIKVLSVDGTRIVIEPTEGI